MTNIEKHDMVADQLILHPNEADRAVASRLDVSPTFVGKVRRYLEEKGKLTKAETRQGQDGRKRRRRRTQDEIRIQRREQRREELLERLRSLEERLSNEGLRSCIGWEGWAMQKQQILDELNSMEDRLPQADEGS